MRSDTIEKIANALNVDINTLFLSENENKELYDNLVSTIDIDKISIQGIEMSKEEKIAFLFANRQIIRNIIEDRKKML